MTHTFARCALGAAMTALATSAELALRAHVPTSPFLLVYPAVVLSAWWAGWEAGAVAIVTAAFVLAYWLLPPAPSIAVAAKRDVVDLAIFCGVSSMVVYLITRTRRALNEARAAQEISETANAAKETVLAVVAHDLRSPLQTIGLSAEILAAEMAGRSTRIELQLGRLRRSAERARRLVDNIIDSARIGGTPFPLEKTSCSLSALVEESVSPFRSLSEARSIQLEVPSNQDLEGSIVCDRNRIVQVLTNLLSNAFQYTARGGKVVIGVRRTSDDMGFFVTDTGCGMTRVELAHAFERLWHGQGPGHGSGLGLWITKALVEAHGGEISAASEVGRGTTMTFVLPQPSPEPSAAREHAPLKQPAYS